MHSICLAVPTLSLITGTQKARVLATTTRGPSVLAPGLPPVGETVPGYELNGWYGMLAPPGTSKAITEKLNQVFSKVVMEPAVRERLLGVGMEPTPSSPVAFGDFLKQETARIGKVLKSAGVKPQDIIVFDRYGDMWAKAGYQKHLPDGVRGGGAVEKYDDVQLDIKGYDPEVYA